MREKLLSQIIKMKHIIDAHYTKLETDQYTSLVEIKKAEKQINNKRNKVWETAKLMNLNDAEVYQLIKGVN